MNKIYGYARCSTNEELQDISRQTRELTELGVKPENIYLEYTSGMTKKKVQLNRLMDTVKEGDTIIATEVSRLTRSTLQLCELIETVKAKRLRLILGTLNIDCRFGDPDPVTMGMLKIMGVVAEMERDMISARVKSGLENARAKGVKLGRPTVEDVEDVPKDFRNNYHLLKNKNLNVSQFAKMLNMSRTTVYKYKKILDNE